MRTGLPDCRTVADIMGADASELPGHIDNFNHSLSLLRNGDAERPLQVPWDEAGARNLRMLNATGGQFHAHWLAQKPGNLDRSTPDTVAFAADS